MDKTRLQTLQAELERTRALLTAYTNGTSAEAVAEAKEFAANLHSRLVTHKRFESCMTPTMLSSHAARLHWLIQTDSSSS